MNLTKEIIDETSILYREDPIYSVVDDGGKQSKADQELWEEIQKDCRYLMFMDKLDRWTKLLGTVLVKVSFVNPDSGELVNQTEGGMVQLDMLHGGTYDIKHGASPYYITELLIGFGTKFTGFGGTSYTGGSLSGKIPNPSNYGAAGIEQRQNIVATPGQLRGVNTIYWSPNSHKIVDEENNAYEGDNPYGLVPAIPFFNQDPAHYYFLPINEPLIYANHALNMRITDLNHIAKFQSFGVPVVSGIERPTSLRQGRPVDDANVLKGGSAQSTFGGLSGVSGFGAGGNFRTFDAGMGLNRDGNADANALGVSIGPDTAIAVGEKGDFKFAHPSADITGLIKTIEGVTDMVRINHGLRPKYKDTLPSSGFALLMEKIGVMEDNIRRAKLFREREQQLFQVIKKLWNTHHSKGGERQFSKGCKLEVTYKEPSFPVDPKTKLETLVIESKLLDYGDRESYRKIYPHLSETDINKKIKQKRKDKLEQAKEDAKREVEVAKILVEGGISSAAEGSSVASGRLTNKSTTDETITMAPKSSPGSQGKVSVDNKAKHSEQSSVQKKKNGDPRAK